MNVALINVIEINPDQLTAADLQAAIAAAASTTLPDLIVVHTTDTQNTITYSSPSDQIAIYAFASQASISIVGYGSNPLTLDANSQCGVVAIFGDYYNSSTTIVGLGGMVLTHGRADSGGGLYQYASNLVMTNVTISENASTGNGGGLFQYYGRLVMTDVTITGNSATRGGGMCQYGGTSDADGRGNQREFSARGCDHMAMASSGRLGRWTVSGLGHLDADERDDQSERGVE